MFTELRQHLWMQTPKGQARCFAVIDYGQEDDLVWVCICQDEPYRGQIWAVHNSQVRVLDNATFLREKADSAPAPAPARATRARA